MRGREGGSEEGREGGRDRVRLCVSEWMDSYLCCYAYTTAHLRLGKSSQQFIILHITQL